MNHGVHNSYQFNTNIEPQQTRFHHAQLEISTVVILAEDRLVIFLC